MVIPGREWWNIKVKMRFEKTSSKYPELKKTFPSEGARLATPLFWIMMTIDPIRRSMIEMNRTEIMTV